MKIQAILVHEKSAPHSHAYGARTEDGILIKVWIPHKLVAKPLAEIGAELVLPEKKSGKKDKGKGKKKRRQEEEDDDEDEEE